MCDLFSALYLLFYWLHSKESLFQTFFRNPTLTLGKCGLEVTAKQVVMTSAGTVALVWQLMRAYTLSILTKLARSGNPIVEKEIVQWVNKKVNVVFWMGRPSWPGFPLQLASAEKKSSIHSFQDSSVSDARVVIDLIDAIKPGCINYSQVHPATTTEVSRAQSLEITRCR